MSALEEQTSSDSRQGQSSARRGSRRLINKYLLIVDHQTSDLLTLQDPVNMENDQSEATTKGHFRAQEMFEEKIVYRDYDGKFNITNNNRNNYNTSNINNNNNNNINNYVLNDLDKTDDGDNKLNDIRVENAFASENVTSPMSRDRPKVDHLDPDGKQRRTNEATDSAHFRRWQGIMDDVDVTFNFNPGDLENVSGGPVVSSLAFDLSSDKPTGKSRTSTSRRKSEMTTTATVGDDRIDDTSCENCNNHVGHELEDIRRSKGQLPGWLLGTVYQFVKHGFVLLPWVIAASGASSQPFLIVVIIIIVVVVVVIALSSLKSMTKRDMAKREHRLDDGNDLDCDDNDDDDDDDDSDIYHDGDSDIDHDAAAAAADDDDDGDDDDDDDDEGGNDD